MNHPQQIGKYTILERIGRGGMGYVYRAVDSILKRDVAVKVMLKDVADDPDLRNRFLREAQSAGGLRHPNIVTIYDLGEDEQRVPYIAMEFLTGTDVEHIIKGHIELQLPKKLEVIMQTCSGLGYAHSRGIVHRDIKPGNIRLLDNGEVKIMDFGIAKITASQFTRTGMIMGTPQYMAPEQIKGEKVDGRADIFSLGVVLYELLTFRKPFPGDNATSVLFKIIHSDPEPLTDFKFTPPPGLEVVVLRALAKKQEDRYQTCEEMNNDLYAVYSSVQEKEQALSATRTSAAFLGSRNPTPGASSIPPTIRPSAARDTEETTITPVARIERKKTPAPDPLVPPVAMPAAHVVLAANPENPAPSTAQQPADLPPITSTDVSLIKRRWVLVGSTGVLGVVFFVVLFMAAYKVLVGSSTNKEPKVTSSPAARKLMDAPKPAVQTPVSEPEATSPPAVEAPVQIQNGWVALNIQPWAEVTEIKNEQGQTVPPPVSLTPCRFALPAGSYQITVTNSTYAPLTLEVEVQPEQLTVIQRNLDGFDSASAIESLATQ